MRFSAGCPVCARPIKRDGVMRMRSLQRRSWRRVSRSRASQGQSSATVPTQSSRVTVPTERNSRGTLPQSANGKGDGALRSAQHVSKNNAVYTIRGSAPSTGRPSYRPMFLLFSCVLCGTSHFSPVHASGRRFFSAKGARNFSNRPYSAENSGLFSTFANFS